MVSVTLLFIPSIIDKDLESRLVTYTILSDRFIDIPTGESSTFIFDSF